LSRTNTYDAIVIGTRQAGPPLARLTAAGMSVAMIERNWNLGPSYCGGVVATCRHGSAQRRRHYIWGFLEGLTGIDMETLGRKPSRGQRYRTETPVARIVGEVAWRGPVFTEALRFAKRHTMRPVKVTLPGPMTIADSVFDAIGRRSDADLALLFAELLNKEAKGLAEAGADVIQFDEPCFNIYVDAVREWGIATLERAMAGVDARIAVHICYGYGVPQVKQWKSRNRDWSHYDYTLPLLAKSRSTRCPSRRPPPTSM
jgi:5-methyltetrahydropteroyltriglutamate--homocysteine methyltransferase